MQSVKEYWTTTKESFVQIFTIVKEDSQHVSLGGAANATLPLGVYIF